MLKKNIYTAAAVLSVGVFGVPFCMFSENVTAHQYQGETAQKSFQLSKKAYKQIKGWWTNRSSDSCNWKITRSKVKAYSRSTGKCVEKLKICDCKKTQNGYIIQVKNSQGQNISYAFNKQSKVFCKYQDDNQNGICDHYENGDCNGGGKGSRSCGKQRGRCAF